MTAVTRIWWVRHGPTHARALTGWRDIPADLSDLAALERLNAHLPQDALILSSDLIRARDTAAALRAGRRPLPADPALREFDFGDWDGLEHDQVTARWPDLCRRYWEEPGDVAPPNGESWHQAAARISAAADRLVRDHAGHDIVAVAHFGAILTQYARGAGLPPYRALAQRIEPLSVTCLAHDHAGWRVETVNLGL